MSLKTILISNSKAYTEQEFTDLNENGDLEVDRILNINTMDLPYGCSEQDILEEIDDVVKNINVTVKRPSWWPINPS